MVEHNLSEEHVLFGCTKLKDIQKKYGLKDYHNRFKGSQTRVLWAFLGGDKCNGRELLSRGKQLQSFLIEYMEKIYQTAKVKELLSTRHVEQRD